MLSDSEQSAIIRSLEKILADEKFSGSPQMSAFLRYVVTETLQGNADRIKAYTVAVDALGKSDAFDPQNDPSVRVLAKRLRTSLDNYYERTSNHEKIIEIRAGSYIPIFSDSEFVPGKPTDVTQFGRELRESRNTQALGIPTAKAPSNQDSIKPIIAHIGNNSGNDSANNLGNNDTDIKAVALGGNTTDSTGVSKSDMDTFNETVSPALVPQESTISGSGKRTPQQADAPLSTTSAKDEKETQAPKPKIGILVSKLFATAQVHKPLSGALLLVTAATLMWGFNSSTSLSRNTETASAGNQSTYALQLASAKTTQSLRQRPAIPTVIVRTDSREDKLSQSLLSSISHVLSKFDHLQVLKPTHEYELTEKWPEDYEIVVDTLIMNDSKKITLNLINAASGRITYSDELYLSGDVSKGDVATGFSKNNITAVELFVARIVQKNGPLLSDYKSQEKYSETMACVFSITGINNESHIGDDCLNKVIAQGQSETIQQTLLAELSLKNLAKKGSSKRKEALKIALTAAQNNLELVPHSADAHALMMRVSQLSGDYSTALKHGNHAMDINDLDSSNMFAFAVLLDELEKPIEANDMRKQASVLSTTLSDLSL